MYFKNKSDEISHIPEDFPALIKSYKLLSKLNKIYRYYFNNINKTTIPKIILYIINTLKSFFLIYIFRRWLNEYYYTFWKKIRF